MNSESKSLEKILQDLTTEIASYEGLANLFDVYYPEYELRSVEAYCSSTLVSPIHRIENRPIGKIRLSSRFKHLDLTDQRLVLRNEIETLLSLEKSNSF